MLNIKKINLLVKLIDEHLKNNKSYKVACYLSESEKVFLKERYILIVKEEYENILLYELALK